MKRVLGKWGQQGKKIWLDCECTISGQDCGGIQFDAKSYSLRRMNKYFSMGRFE
jgi:hypothetical protein